MARHPALFAGAEAPGFLGNSRSITVALGHLDSGGVVDFADVLHVAEAFFAGGLGGFVLQDAV